MPQKMEYTVLDLIESAVRQSKVSPLNLGGGTGPGGGTGGPPGGFIGQLPQRKVAYDTTEAATLFTPSSGMSLVDNLNHIRYRILQLEGWNLTVEDYDGNPSVSNVNRIVFSGATITNQGYGRVLVVVSGGGGGTALTVGELDGAPMVSNVDTILFSGAYVTDLGGGNVQVSAAPQFDWFRFNNSDETLEFGADVGGKESNAGKIGYETYGAGYLYIVGAGTTGGDRRVKIFDKLYVDGDLFVNGGQQVVPAEQVTNGDSHDHSGGDGGQINFTTLANPPIAETNAADVLRVNSAGASTFSGTINGTPSGTSVVYNAGFSGNENALVPANTNQIGKMRLYNTTRGNSALISTTNTGTNTITLTATVPANWASGDTITIASQTVTGGGFNWIDVEITSGPTGKSHMFFNIQCVDTTGTNIGLRLHPLNTFGSGKIAKVLSQVTNVTNDNFALIPITSDVFSVSWEAGGAASMTIVVREAGYLF